MTSNSEPCLIFDPTDELRFKGPFDKNVSTTTLKITNTSAKRVTFKVKTTAPKNYCVRPNQGVVEPGATFAVSVMLQPFDYDPNEKQKHKFLVQTMFMPPGDDVEVEALWKNANEENIMPSAKMRCVFEMPDGSGEAVADRTSEFGSRAASSLGSVASAASASAASDETKRLSEQQTAQINEDIQRKEELIRKRRVTHGVDASSPMLGASPRQGAGGAMGAVQAPAEPIIYVVVGLLTLMIGYLIGKFF